MTDPIRTPAAFYDALSAQYDAMTDFDARMVRERPFLHVLVDRHEIRTAIDVGTGTGIHAVLLAQLRVRVTAVDVSGEMLRLARMHAARHRVRVRTLQADVTDLADTVSSTFDAALCLGNTLVHVHRAEDLGRVLHGFRRIVQRKGVVVLQVLNYDRIPADREHVLSARERNGLMFERSYRPNGSLLEFRTTVRQGPRTDVQAVLHRPWRSDELVAALHHAGFDAVERYGGIDLKPFDAETSTDLFLIATTAGS